METDHEERGALRNAAEQNLQELRGRLQEIEGLIEWGKAVLDEVEGQARKLALEYGWPGESQASQR